MNGASGKAFAVHVALLAYTFAPSTTDCIEAHVLLNTGWKAAGTKSAGLAQNEPGVGAGPQAQLVLGSEPTVAAAPREIVD